LNCVYLAPRARTTPHDPVASPSVQCRKIRRGRAHGISSHTQKTNCAAPPERAPCHLTRTKPHARAPLHCEEEEAVRTRPRRLPRAQRRPTCQLAPRSPLSSPARGRGCPVPSVAAAVSIPAFGLWWWRGRRRPAARQAQTGPPRGR
jgi:hypothetical protein